MKSKIKRNFVKFFTVLLGLVFLSVGCGGGGNGQPKSVTLTMWGVFDDSQSIQPLLEAYRKVRPNVQIVYTKKDINSYYSDLLNALAAGTGPDIYSIHNDWLPAFLDKTMPATDKQWIFNDYKNDFVDVAVKDFTKDQ